MPLMATSYPPPGRLTLDSRLAFQAIVTAAGPTGALSSAPPPPPPHATRAAAESAARARPAAKSASAAAEAKALFCQRQERQQLGFLGGFLFGAAVGDELREFRHLRRPASVVRLLVDDGEMHQRGALAPPWPATDSFQITASSTA